MICKWPFRGEFRFGTLYGVAGKLWACGWHCGLDLGSEAAGGDGMVFPISEGLIERAGPDGRYGNSLRIRHPDGHMSLYAHLDRVLVRPGQRVTPDTLLGYEGSTGNSTQKHLHIEIHSGIYKYPAQIDPKIFITERLEKEDDMTIYRTKDDLPEWGRPAVEAALAATSAPGTSPTGRVLTGDRNRNLNLSEDMLRIIVLMHRTRLFG